MNRSQEKQWLISQVESDLKNDRTIEISVPLALIENLMRELPNPRSADMELSERLVNLLIAFWDMSGTHRV